MKNMKKVFALVLVAVMVLALSATAIAAGTGTITITPPSNVDADATNTYKIYKVFDADASADGSSVSYKLVEGKSVAPAGFTVDGAGNVKYVGEGQDNQLTQADITAIAAYVANDQPVATVTSTGTAAAVAENLPNGYYYITTSTGSVVTIDTAKPDAAVNDKNTVPTVDKKITGELTLDEAGKKAMAQVGTTVPYEATITVGKGAKNYVFHDKMGTGLRLNDTIEVTAVPAIEGTWYTIKETPDTGDTLTISFKDGIAENTKITIKYSATVTSDALTVDTGKNTATISYGDNNGYNSTPSETNVYNAKITVTKKDGNNTVVDTDDTPLAGAGFVLARNVAAVGTEGQEGYVAAHYEYYKIENNVVSWVTDINAATERTSAEDGKVPSFTGLDAGEYVLVEKTVPSGYNKAADQPVTVAANFTENVEVPATVLNNKGAELPSTGGIGTTIFYVLGAMLMAGAVVLLVTKKRVGNVK